MPILPDTIENSGFGLFHNGRYRDGGCLCVAGPIGSDTV